MIKERIDVEYSNPVVRKAYEKVCKIAGTVDFEKILLDIAGGATPLRADDKQYAEDGIKFLRIQNITEFGIDLDNVKFITGDVHNELLKRSQLQADNLLFTITGRIGTTSIVTNDVLPANINQHIARLTVDKKKVDIQFLCYYLNSTQGLVLSNRGVTGTTRLALDYGAIKKIPIPCIDISEQKRLAKKMNVCVASYQSKLAQADEFLSGMDEYVGNLLGHSSDEMVKKLSWTVVLGSLRGNRLDANSYKPTKSHDFTSEVKLMPLKSVASINANERPKISNGDDLVPYIGLPECSLTEVEKVTYRPYSEVQGRITAIPGDILFARIEPSVFNKKYVLADDLKGSEYAFVSTEFYAVRANEDVALQKYLYTMLFSSYVYSQIAGKTTGSSGRRRIDRSMFEEVLIPIPSKPIQQKIADEAVRRRTLARQLKDEANREWQAAKVQFEKKLLRE